MDNFNGCDIFSKSDQEGVTYVVAADIKAFLLLTRRWPSTCWVLEHGLGVAVRVDEAPQQYSHVGDFVLRQLFQSGLQELEKTSYTVCFIHLQNSNVLKNSAIW